MNRLFLCSDIDEAQFTNCQLIFLPFLCSLLHILYILLSSLQIDEQLVQSSGKFLILDRLLPALKKRGHKVKQYTLVCSDFFRALT